MSHTHEPLSDLLGAVAGAIDVPAVTSVAVGGVHDDTPESPTYPWIRVTARAKPIGPIAAQTIWRCDVEIHVYDQYQGDSQALGLVNTIVGLLHYQALTVEGWTAILASLDDEGFYPLPPEEIAGQVTREWVVPFTVQMERAA